jgi:hypothetical protein
MNSADVERRAAVYSIVGIVLGSTNNFAWGMTAKNGIVHLLTFRVSTIRNPSCCRQNRVDQRRKKATTTSFRNVRVRFTLGAFDLLLPVDADVVDKHPLWEHRGTVR